MELLHQPGDIIAERYRILDTLGQGGVGITYQAQDLQTGEQVALKALSLRRMADWKVLELFEREARILSQLNHPAIPRYIDYFQVDAQSDRSFYIAQQLAPGKSLAALVESGWHPNEEQVRHLATQVLEILAYLHSLTPPVIHRDIKPQNIILRSPLAKEGWGDLFLVDFGAVQDTYHNTVTGGSTVVGTYGYMAPEQFRGQAVLSTDLYGLGTTLLFLLTRKSPAELPQRKLKIDFRSHVSVSKDFADWLEKMLEPVIEDRFPSANAALAVLRGEETLATYSTQKLRQPKYSPISLTNTDGRVIVDIPPVWLSSASSRLFALIPLVWNGFLLLMLWIVAASASIITLDAGILLGGFGLIGLWMLGTFLFSAASRTRLELDCDNFQLQRWFLGMCYQKVQARTEDISELKLSGIGLKMNKNPITVFMLRERMRKHRFGSFLMETEKEWLLSEITAFLEKQPRKAAAPPSLASRR
jgi:serine/threonine protein kinase